ncbi:hypothetical protein GQ53DRAFT_330752 [Thozetella sp. PMI_491]|nr:hypothetical protein GQ53DRAFT_330752 [Thozetella sp. PMI_491]
MWLIVEEKGKEQRLDVPRRGRVERLACLYLDLGAPVRNIRWERGVGVSTTGTCKHPSHQDPSFPSTLARQGPGSHGGGNTWGELRLRGRATYSSGFPRRIWRLGSSKRSYSARHEVRRQCAKMARANAGLLAYVWPPMSWRPTRKGQAIKKKTGEGRKNQAGTHTLAPTRADWLPLLGGGGESGGGSFQSFGSGPEPSRRGAAEDTDGEGEGGGGPRSRTITSVRRWQRRTGASGGARGRARRNEEGRDGAGVKYRDGEQEQGTSTVNQEPPAPSLGERMDDAVDLQRHVLRVRDRRGGVRTHGERSNGIPSESGELHCPTARCPGVSHAHRSFFLLYFSYPPAVGFF